MSDHIYKIKYTYDTGDSFHTESDREGILEMSWKDLEVAKANLNRIKEHYEFYCVVHSNGYRIRMTNAEKDKVLAAARKKDWFAKDYDFCLILKTDNGKDWQFNAPWCGYFERLNEAEIVEDHSDRKISFR